jgi:hypothetical protein
MEALIDLKRERCRKSRRDWYARNKAHAIQKVGERKAEIREWFNSLKGQLKCLICGEDHIGCLEFHHEDPGLKEDSLAMMVHNGASKQKLLAEIAKCKTLCANCHRKLHWDQRHTGE